MCAMVGTSSGRGGQIMREVYVRPTLCPTRIGSAGRPGERDRVGRRVGPAVPGVRQGHDDLAVAPGRDLGTALERGPAVGGVLVDAGADHPDLRVERIEGSG